MSEIVLLGGGGHARVVLNLLSRVGFSVLGYVAPERSVEPIAATYLGTDSECQSLAVNAALQAAIGIGKVDASTARLDLLSAIQSLGVVFPVIQSPDSMVHEDVVLGSGSVVMDRAAVITGSTIGRGCIVNTGATIDHDCHLEDDVHIAPGAVLCGGVRIGSSTLVGAGAVVAPSVSVPESCIIGAGSTVTADIVASGVYAGSPARRIAGTGRRSTA